MPKKLKLFPGQESAAPVGIGEMGVAAVDDEIAGCKQGQQFPEHRVHRVAGRHQQDEGPGPAQETDEFFQVVPGLDGAGAHLVFHEVPGLLGGAVIHRHGKAVVRHVQDKIAPHGPQADEADVTTLVAHKISD